MNIRQVVLRGVTALVVLTGVVVAAPSAAHAGPSCDWTGCSETINQSAFAVYVARD